MLFWREKLLWLPMSLLIFMVYAIQRGFTTLAKADMMVPHMMDSLAIFFTTMSIAALLGGLLLDNISGRKVLPPAIGLGLAGLMFLPTSAWGFGILFGLSAALLKLIPYSTPLKLSGGADGSDSLRIAPQAAAKNLGGAAFLLFLGAALKKLGMEPTMLMMLFAFSLIGYFAFTVAPDDRIDGWKPEIFKQLAKDTRFWRFMAYLFAMVGMYYVAVFQFYPGLKAHGFTGAEALVTIAISYIFQGALRFLWGFVGQWDRPLIMFAGTAGIAMVLIMNGFGMNPIVSLTLFTLSASVHTPNYWAYAKETWGKRYLGTVMGLGFFFMYLGAGVIYGKW